MTETLATRIARAEEGFGSWASRRGVTVLRVALGILFVWFGVLKFCPGLCEVEILAYKTTHLFTLSLVPAKVCLRLLAMVESGIGAALIAGRWMRVVTVCLMLHLFGSFLPMVLFPCETWKHFPYAPTLVGQYILKNVVLIAAALVIGAAAFVKVNAPVIVSMRKRHREPQNCFVELNGANTRVIAMRSPEWRRF